MSIEAIRWAFKQNVKNSSAKLLLVALADYANDDFVSYPSYSTLEEKCSCSRPTISASVKFLMANGFIEKACRNFIGKNYDNGQTCYKLLVKEFNQLNNLTSKKSLPEVVKNFNQTSKKSLPEVVKNFNSNHHITINKPPYNHYKEKDKKESSEKTTESKSSIKKFIPPTLEEISAFISEKEIKNVNPDGFFYHYESNGWMVGKNKMKNWQATIRNWSARARDNPVQSKHRKSNMDESSVQGSDYQYPNQTPDHLIEEYLG